MEPLHSPIARQLVGQRAPQLWIAEHESRGEERFREDALALRHGLDTEPRQRRRVERAAEEGGEEKDPERHHSWRTQQKSAPA